MQVTSALAVAKEGLPGTQTIKITVVAKKGMSR